MEFTITSSNNIFDIHSCHGIKLPNRLHLGLSHVSEHKSKHGFNDKTNAICICGTDIEIKNHFFLHCPEFSDARQTLIDNIQRIDKKHCLVKSIFRLAEFFTVILSIIPMLTQSSWTRKLNLHHLQEDSTDHYLTKLKNLFSFQ